MFVILCINLIRSVITVYDSSLNILRNSDECCDFQDDYYEYNHVAILLKDKTKTKVITTLKKPGPDGDTDCKPKNSSGKTICLKCVNTAIILSKFPIDFNETYICVPSKTETIRFFKDKKDRIQMMVTEAGKYYLVCQSRSGMHLIEAKKKTDDNIFLIDSNFHYFNMNHLNLSEYSKFRVLISYVKFINQSSQRIQNIAEFIKY